MENENQAGKTFFGVSSLLLVMAALGLGLAIIVSNSRLFGWLYAAIIVCGFIAIVYSFCAKCPCRAGGCGHLFPGLLARRLPRRRPGPYTKGDIVGLLLPLALMAGLPQFWLQYSRTLLLTFWFLLVIAGIEIRAFVCPGCANRDCPAAIKR